MERPYQLRIYQNGDESQIINLFRSVFGKTLTLAQWHWKYHPPAGNRIHSHVATDASGKLIAHIGALPMIGSFLGNDIRLFQIVDIMVEKGSRGHSIESSVYVDLAKQVFETISEQYPSAFCYGFPGERPYKAGHYFGLYDRIEQAPLVKLDLSTRMPYFPFFKLRKLDWADPAIDLFWGRYPINDLLLINRDRNYLQWRYANNPYRDYCLLGLYQFSRLRGWVVYSKQGKNITIVDLLVNRAFTKQMPAVLSRHLKKQGANEISMWLPPMLRKGFPGSQSNASDIVVTNVIWNMPIETAVARSHLYYTMGDNDIY